MSRYRTIKGSTKLLENTLMYVVVFPFSNFHKYSINDGSLALGIAVWIIVFLIILVETV